MLRFCPRKLSKRLRPSTSFAAMNSDLNDVQCAEAIKAKNPHAQIGLIGAHVAILPSETLKTSPAIDFVCRNEFRSERRAVRRSHQSEEPTRTDWFDWSACCDSALGNSQNVSGHRLRLPQ